MNKEELRAKVIATANPKPLPILGIPEWDGVHAKRLTVAETEGVGSVVDDKQRSARSLARVLCTPEGELLFDENNSDDLEIIGAVASRYITEVSKAMELSGASTVEAAKDLGNALPRATG